MYNPTIKHFSRSTFLVVEAAGTRKINAFVRGIYGSDVFIASSRAVVFANSLREFIRAYMWEAFSAAHSGLPLFPLFPKLHFLQEVAFTMMYQSQRAHFAFNPACTSCATDEDFIGRCALITRCVSPKLTCRRTIERYLCFVQQAWGRRNC